MPINVNKQIEEAMERGEFKNLPGEGKPLKLDTNPYLTPQARMANRLLKENGFTPRWIALKKEIKKKKRNLKGSLKVCKVVESGWRLSPSSIHTDVKPSVEVLNMNVPAVLNSTVRNSKT